MCRAIDRYSRALRGYDATSVLLALSRLFGVDDDSSCTPCFNQLMAPYTLGSGDEQNDTQYLEALTWLNECYGIDVSGFIKHDYQLNLETNVSNLHRDVVNVLQGLYKGVCVEHRIGFGGCLSVDCYVPEINCVVGGWS